ncbi:M48 family metallopeptidase [Candidiatus Paracoxiella cheracis]|uniref:M48 family metallopeptidase n=1 Tax=Candidiatus Paracoxiella cheracis TaxID=3405120 RepID=UPI003BF558B6
MTIKKTFWPEKIDLHAVALSWQLRYEPLPNNAVIALNQSDRALTFVGPIKTWDDCRPSFNQWLKQQSRRYLEPWLQKLSHDYQLIYKNLTFRGQKTVWGSCSSKKNINLNYKLLFLPARLVRYVLAHELCHIVHLDHSRRFWALVEQYEPDYARLKKELRHADHYMPEWIIK